MTGTSIFPAGMTMPGDAQVLTVRTHEVEAGDRLVGLRSVVKSVLFDGNVGRWLYADAWGTIFATRAPWQSVQVLRGGLTDDDTPPHGIERPSRHLRLVAVAR